jgi:YD repeat-containing protein
VGRGAVLGLFAGTIDLTTTTQYDGLGRAYRTIYALGHATQTVVYDDAGRVERTVFDDGSYTSAAYDNLGRRTSQTDQLGRTTSYEYDVIGNLTAVELPMVDDPADGLPNTPEAAMEGVLRMSGGSI